MLWKGIERWWLQILQTSVKLNSAYVLFGIVNTEDDSIIDIFNLCILLAKWHIYNCKKNNGEPSFLEYLKMLKDHLQIEKLCCLLEDNAQLFEKRWSLLYESL